MHFLSTYQSLYQQAAPTNNLWFAYTTPFYRECDREVLRKLAPSQRAIVLRLKIKRLLFLHRSKDSTNAIDEIGDRLAKLDRYYGRPTDEKVAIVCVTRIDLEDVGQWLTSKMGVWVSVTPSPVATIFIASYKSLPGE